MKLNEEIQQLLRTYSLPAEVGRKIGLITIYNQGDSTAEGCRVTWYSISRNWPNGESDL